MSLYLIHWALFNSKGISDAKLKIKNANIQMIEQNQHRISETCITCYNITCYPYNIILVINWLLKCLEPFEICDLLSVCYVWHDYNFHCTLTTIIVSFLSPVLWYYFCIHSPLIFSSQSSCFLVHCILTHYIFSLTPSINTLCFFFLCFSWKSKPARQMEENSRTVVFVIAFWFSLLWNEELTLIVLDKSLGKVCSGC